MTFNLIRKTGIPAFAHTPSDTASLLSCTLFIKYHYDRKQATISLQSSMSIHNFEDEQSFTFIYNAENLVYGASSLKPAITSLAQTQMDQIARHSDLKLATLILTIKTPCPLWCPATSGSIAAKDGSDAPFRQLVNFSRATQIHILFDFKWLQPDNQRRLLSFIKQPQLFTGFPIDYKDTGYKLADWSVFSPFEDASCGALPSYAEAANKRPRTSSTSSIESPPSKRVFHLAAPTSAPSPTEEATTASTPSPRLPSSPAANASDVQQSVEEAVEKLLPNVLKKTLLDMLPQLLAVSPPPSSPASTFSAPHGLLAPIPTPMSSFRTLISAQVAARVEAHLCTICDEILDHALSLRSTADDEFLESVQDHKVDVQLIKDDSIADMQGEIDSKLAEFKEHAGEIVQEAAEQAEKVYNDVFARLDELAERTKMRMKSDSHILGWSSKHMDTEKQRGPEEHGTGHRMQRAKSMPL